jgi:DNA replication protein DnaC
MIGKGLILVGPAGSGKSRLACATATTVHRAYNTSMMYMPVTNYFALNRDLPGEDDSQEVARMKELKKQVLRRPLLVWDDLGKEYTSASDWVGKEVHRILRTRFDKGLPSIITSNVPLRDWSARYDEAMFSFLHEAFDTCALAASDWRRAGK